MTVIFNQRFSLPHVVGDFTVECQGALPAFFATDPGDEFLHVGGDGTVTAVVFIIGGAAALGDEAALDAVLRVAGHISVEAGHADGHCDGAVVAEQVAAALGGWGVTGIDAGDDVAGTVDVVADRPAEALFVKGTFGIETDHVFLGLFAEDLFLVFHLIVLGCVICLQR